MAKRKKHPYVMGKSTGSGQLQLNYLKGDFVEVIYKGHQVYYGKNGKKAQSIFEHYHNSELRKASISGGTKQ